MEARGRDFGAVVVPGAARGVGAADGPGPRGEADYVGEGEGAGAVVGAGAGLGSLISTHFVLIVVARFVWSFYTVCVAGGAGGSQHDRMTQ